MLRLFFFQSLVWWVGKYWGAELQHYIAALLTPFCFFPRASRWVRLLASVESSYTWDGRHGCRWRIGIRLFGYGFYHQLLVTIGGAVREVRRTMKARFRCSHRHVFFFFFLLLLYLFSRVSVVVLLSTLVRPQSSREWLYFFNDCCFGSCNSHFVKKQRCVQWLPGSSSCPSPSPFVGVLFSFNLWKNIWMLTPNNFVLGRGGPVMFRPFVTRY